MPNVKHFSIMGQVIDIYDETAHEDIENLKQTVQNLQNTLSNIFSNKKHIVCIGDSFTATNVRAYSWPTQIDDTYTVHNYAIGSTGFIQTTGGQANSNFSGQLDTAISDKSYDHNLVKSVIIYGGYNDFASGKTYSDVRTAISDIVKKATSNFTGANIICVVGNAGVWNRDNQKGYAVWTDNLLRGSEAICTPVVNANWWLWGFGTSTVFNSDNLHPNAQGAAIIARYMQDLINGCFNPGALWYDTPIQNNETNPCYFRYNPEGVLTFTGAYNEFPITGTDSSVEFIGDDRFVKDPEILCAVPAMHCSDPEVFSGFFSPRTGLYHVFSNKSSGTVNIYF